MIKTKVKRLNYFSSILGLMFGFFKPPVCFNSRWGIHTFFVPYPIDIVILDNNSKVVKVEFNLLPNKLYFWEPKYFHVLEFRSGYIKKNNIKIGDKLIISYK